MKNLTIGELMVELGKTQSQEAWEIINNEIEQRLDMIDFEDIMKG